MQTFLTSYSFIDSAKNLDNKRLNKQCLEAIQLYELCTNRLFISKSFPENYRNHPACKWWQSNPSSLAYYIFCHVNELYNRFGKAGTIWNASIDIANSLNYDLFTGVPEFLSSKIVESHRSALLYKTECNYWLHQYCFNNGLPLNSINEKNSYDFVDFLLINSNVDEFSTMRWSESSKVPTIANVNSAHKNFLWYKAIFRESVSKLTYVWHEE